ncbi:hypothetical protein SAMN05421505_12047 [Sinosporangium album]|uniref:Uncharacterized protein n=1 Tax=Sinosporangium album TaxID=504805 RepID=A0A1G8EDH1_9ACTN|nr:hypothetical protein [Sinosporangium album]SDH67830.1 hypothetical protein SAMN05421505_12047 [Sinosporangium album]
MTALLVPQPHTLPRGDSQIASRMLSDLMGYPPEVRRRTLGLLAAGDLVQILAVAGRELGTPYSLWLGDPVGFVEQVLGERLWSKQQQILHAITTHKTVAVPAGFGLGKTHLAARAVLYWTSVYPVGTALAITTATRMRQVYRQMWPHIRRAVARANLPGSCDQVQYKMTDRHGVDVVVAYGFTAVEHDESGMQGIHESNLLLIVDEAGGIGPVIGRSTRNLLTGSNARMLAIGNPPTDQERSWFEKLCGDGDDYRYPQVTTIPLAATDSPSVTGERISDQVCGCPAGEQGHLVSSHLVDQEWIDGAIRDHGPTSPYVIAKVHARFPRGTKDQMIPSDWVDAAADQEEPEGDEWVRLCDLDLPEEQDEWVVGYGAWIRLGVDVASDGGDEFVIARLVGDLATIEHFSAGADNADAVTVANQVLREIHRAERLRLRLRTKAQVRVKIDTIGVGWGVVSLLQRWRQEGMHDAEIVPVNVAEEPGRSADSELLRPYIKRDEMWIAGRTLLQPDREGRTRLRLRVDDKTKAQLSGPKKLDRSTGHTQVEPKKAMRKRGLPSPDRAEALLHCPYEPAPRKPKKRGRLLVG